MSIINRNITLMHNSAKVIPSYKVKGFTLIEILVTMVILAVGLLGMASLQLTGLRSNQSAFLRTQASTLAYDMADRMRANAPRALAGDYTNFDTNGNPPTDPNCIATTSGCSATAQAATDKIEWQKSFKGDTNVTAFLPNGKGVITRTSGTNLFTITIYWNETQWNEASGQKVDSAQAFALKFGL